MKTIYTTLLYTFLLLGLCASCEDDLTIELEDDDDLLAEELFETPGAYQRAIAGVYANLSVVGLDDPGTSNLSGIDAGTGQYIRGLFNLQNLPTDEVIWSYESDPGIREIQRNSWSASNPIVLGFFARANFEIALANEFLRQTTAAKLEGRGVSSGLKSEIKTFRAEARVLRALSYYHLMDLFGRSAFLTENDAVGFIQGPEIKREGLFSFIEEELLAVQDDLLDVNPGATENYGRVNKGVAKMILAKIYLNAEVYFGASGERYEDCLRVCEELINSGYSLTPNYLYNFLADNDTNGAQNEIIFPVVNDGVSVRNFGGTTILIQGQVGSPESNGESLGVQPDGFTGLFRLRKEFSELFTTNPLFEQDSRNTIISTNRPIEIDDVSDRASGYLLAKYSNLKSNGDPGQDATFTDTDFPVFRLADVYLMYAEAHLRGGGGDITTATQYVNDLRTRAFGDPSANITQGQLTLDFLIDERSRELHWECHRRQDLIRFGRYTGSAYNWTYKGGPKNGASISENFRLYPVPEQSRAVNQNLGQNPGF